MPRKTFVAGEVLAATDVNTYLMDQAVMTFAGSAARGSAIASPSEGMVSYLEDTDSVEVYDSTNWIQVGGTQPGNVIQVVSATKTTAFSTSSTSFVDITDLSVSITPSATTSKILVFANVMLGNSGTARTDVLQLVRDSTAISVSTDGGSSSGSNAVQLATNASIVNGNVTHLDSPSTTSATTYKVQILTNADTAYVNRRGLSNVFSGTSNITVMEIAG